MKYLVLVALLTVGCASHTNVGRAAPPISNPGALPELPHIITIQWDMLYAYPDKYIVQVDDRSPAEVFWTTNCDYEIQRICWYQTALYDYNVHRISVWGVKGSEVGPKAIMNFSLADQTPNNPTAPVGLTLQILK